MEQIDFGKRSGFQIPRANIGAMRLPDDTDEAVALIRYAIDSGMVYIDTSLGYGESEVKLGKALKDGYREKVILSTKWCPWNLLVEDTDVPSADCMRKRMDQSMKRLDVDYLDFHQIWSVNNREQFDQATAPGGMLDGIRKARDEGLVGHIGFTTHDKPESLLEYLPDADWCEVLLVTYNLMNVQYAPVLELAHRLGIGTIVMNPVGGGRLAEPSPVLVELVRETGAESVADLALRYVLSNPNVDTIIPGINKPSDVDDAIAAVEAGPLAQDQLAYLNEFVQRMADEKAAFCTGCRYCMPCPLYIEIPSVMNAVFEDRQWGLANSARRRYHRINGVKADACVECGQCEDKCTQQLNIIEAMRYAQERFGDKAVGQ